MPETVHTEPSLIQPRGAAADAFEQNPLRAGSARPAPIGISSLPDDAKVKEAVRKVLEEGAVVGEVAREFGLAPSSIYKWRKRYEALLDSSPKFESNPNAANDVVISADSQVRFEDNWRLLLERTHAGNQDFKQDPLEVFLQTSTATSWLYNEEGQLEKGTLLGALVAVFGIACFMLFLMVDRGRVEPLTEAELNAGQQKVRHDLDVEKAGAVVRKFLKTDGWRSKLLMIRNAEEMEASVRDYFSRHSDKPILDGVLQYGMCGYGIVSVSFEIPSRGDTLFFNCVPDGHSYKIDWETSSLFQRENIERFVAEKPQTPVRLHVQVRRGDYYNFQWADPEKYQCYELRFPGHDRTLYAYSDRESQLGLRLLALTGIAESHAAVLEARFPAEPKTPPQVEITNLLTDEWIDLSEAVSIQRAYEDAQMPRESTP